MEALEIVCGGISADRKLLTEHTGRGEDISPEFAIKGLSPNAKTLIITLEDMSHPIKRFTHWIIWNIPAAEVIPKAIPRGKTVPGLKNAAQGVAYGFHRYAGPKPPRGKTHRYCFTVYALDGFLDLKPYSSKRKVLNAAGDRIIQKGEVCGYYE